MIGTVILVAGAVLVALAAAGVVLLGRRRLRRVAAEAEALRAAAEQEHRRIVARAQQEAEQLAKDAAIEAREKLLQARSEFERETREYRQELLSQEQRLEQRALAVDERARVLEERARELDARKQSLDDREVAVALEEDAIAARVAEQRATLERIAGMTSEQAKAELMRAMETEARMDAARIVRRIEEEATQEANNRAKRIISLAIQRVAAEHVVESTVSVVDLPNDEMKGRIIGREGRNIRALETATGVDLIVDDTPGAVLLSCFDPVRREVARLALQRLMSDGRIHPGRIEEVVAKVQAELDEKIFRDGEAAALELGFPDVHPELLKLLGRLQYRTSYGQNVLAHAKEVAWLAGYMANELRVNVRVAKRAGLLHDIGKAIDREMEGTHLTLGRDLLRKYGESEDVIHAMECHHGDVDPHSVEAVLVTAADALSAARPGARREILESYLKRLEKLEAIAADFKGVQKAFAIQAGRELRIIVESEKLSDEDAIWLSRDLARRIEAELTYPGQIKVTVIRETRAVEYAR
ncbi:MAG TPA: ribonuclease Y [Thermoanaerobaculaceae bacterium]|nr:ribonuclease Y [Thermoanaerobaculaceae bacterium]HRS16233.1 ribonuclease Y [Thermoanaerobaculaceae bacterium]